MINDPNDDTTQRSTSLDDSGDDDGDSGDTKQDVDFIDYGEV